MNSQRKAWGVMVGRTMAPLVIALLAALGLAAIAIAGPSERQSGKPTTGAEVEMALVGTWRLTSAPIIDQNGDVVGGLFGDDPVGKLTYTPEGDVWALRWCGGPDRSDEPDLVHWVRSRFASAQGESSTMWSGPRIRRSRARNWSATTRCVVIGSFSAAQWARPTRPKHDGAALGRHRCDEPQGSATVAWTRCKGHQNCRIEFARASGKPNSASWSRQARVRANKLGPGMGPRREFGWEARA